MKKETKNKITEKGNILKFIIPIVLLLLITIGTTFAYFTASITGTESTTTITVSGGTMDITFNGEVI